MLVWEQISCSQRGCLKRAFRDNVLHAKDLESETVKSRSRNGAPFALTYEGVLTISGSDFYEFTSRVVCALHVSPLLESPLSIYFR